MIQLLDKHSKSLNNIKKNPETTLQFSEDGFLPVERFSPLVISGPP